MTEFSARLLDWYAEHGRDLPWRHTREPYLIWLSEVILQQTRVEFGRAYYERFVERFPTVRDLAMSSEEEVLKLWQGLGYYSRARNLHQAARAVVEKFGGEFPRSYEQVLQLKGVGDYTGAAICAFAYDAPCAVVDGNVYRVLSRLYDEATPIDTTCGKKLFRELALTTMGKAQPSLYNQAIMDFGALQCTPTPSSCDLCPVMEMCLAKRNGTITERPVKQKSIQQRERWFNYLHLTCGDLTLLRQRGAGDIWQGLHEFPLIETAEEVDFKQLVTMPEVKDLLPSDFLLKGLKRLPPYHLTHQLLHATVWRLEVKAFTETTSKWAIPSDRLAEKAIPRLLDKYLENPLP